MKVYVYALLDRKGFNPDIMETLNDVIIEGIAIYLHENYFPDLYKLLIKNDMEIRILDDLNNISDNIKEIGDNVEAGDMVFMVNFAINTVTAYVTMDQATFLLGKRNVMHFCLSEMVVEVDSKHTIIYEIPNDEHRMASLVESIMKKNGWVFKTEMCDDAVAETEKVEQKKSASKSKALVIYDKNIPFLSTTSPDAKDIVDTLSNYFDEIVSKDYGGIDVYDDIDSINQYDNIFIIGPLDSSYLGRILYIKFLFELVNNNSERYYNFIKTVSEDKTFIIEVDRSRELPEKFNEFKNLIEWHKVEDRNRLKEFLSRKRGTVNSTTTEKSDNCEGKVAIKFVILNGGDEFNSLYVDQLNCGKYCNSYTTMDVVSSKDNVTDILFTDKLKDMGLPVVIDINSIVDSSEKSGIDGLKILVSVFHRLGNLDIKRYVVAGLSKSISVGLIPLTVLIDISKMNNVLIKDDDITEIDRFFECVANRKDYDRPIL